MASSSTASLHTSAVARAVSSQATAASAARSHKEDRAAARRLRAANAPHVVLGTRPGDEAAWANSDLARILVTEASLRDAPAGVPGYGVAPGTPDARLLLGALPALTAEAVCLNASAVKGAGDAVEPAQMVRQLGIEGEKAEQLRRLLDLRNADAAGLMFENRRRCVEEFSAPGKPHDSGRVEVQGACFILSLGKATLLNALRSRHPDHADPQHVGPPYHAQEGPREPAQPAQDGTPASENPQVPEAD
jgi:small subunit ribosomal protein S15